MLTDIDRNSDDRSSPSINSHDNLVSGAMMARGSNSMNYTTVNPNTSGNKALQLGLGRLVQVGSFLASNNGATASSSYVPHGLVFTPIVMGSINNATVSLLPEVVDIPMPTQLHSFIDVPNNVVDFRSWIYMAVGATNVYAIILNSTGAPVSITVTYYLYQQRSSQ